MGRGGVRGHIIKGTNTQVSCLSQSDSEFAEFNLSINIYTRNAVHSLCLQTYCRPIGLRVEQLLLIAFIDS